LYVSLAPIRDGYHLLTRNQMWEVITPSDGKPRQFQWTARVEGNDNVFPSKREFFP